MKKLVLFIAILSFFFLNEKVEANSYQVGIGFNYFYSSLSPHGRWIEIDDGLVVWKPRMNNRHWQPYSQGTWVWTNDGWYWDSYEPFGYVVYHYGRWHYDNYYGWIWVPDYQWAPAWVEWRYDDDYIGWAPLPPYAVFNIHSGIHYSVNFSFPYNHWNFIRYKHFGHKNAYNYYEEQQYKERIFGGTKTRNDYGYERDRVINRGVDFRTVQERGARNLQQRELVRSNTEATDRNSIIKTGNRIEILTPRNQAQTGDRNFSIERGERRSSLNTSKVEVGERRSNLDKSQSGKIDERNKVKLNERIIEDENKIDNRKPATKQSAKGGERKRDVQVQQQNEVKSSRSDEIKSREVLREKPIESKPVERKREVQPQKENRPVERIVPNTGRKTEQRAATPPRKATTRESDDKVKERRR
jgi:hypothetical protein